MQECHERFSVAMAFSSIGANLAQNTHRIQGLGWEKQRSVRQRFSLRLLFERTGALFVGLSILFYRNRLDKGMEQDYKLDCLDSFCTKKCRIAGLKPEDKDVIPFIAGVGVFFVRFILLACKSV